MNEKTIAHEISALLSKINASWNSAARGENGVLRIEKDIMMNDLRVLYDKMFQLPVNEDNIPKNKPLYFSQEPSTMMFSETIPDMEVPKETGKFTMKYSDQNPEKQGMDEPFFASTPDNQPKQEIQQNLVQRNQEQHAKPAVKTMADIFPSAKTVADIYQNSTDNSVAAKMQNHKISDLRAAIGINEKLLFIRDIFDNDNLKYNQAIDFLNKTENFYEALQFIDQLKAEKISDDNKAAFAKLLDFSKRKFY